MPVKRIGWKPKGLLPAISLLSVFFLLTGEFFNCCRINEAISIEVRRVVDAFGSNHGPVPISTASEGDPHAHCHGREIQSQPRIDLDVFSGVPGYAQDGSCISEFSITKKSMLESVAPVWIIPTVLFAVHGESVPVILDAPHRPRPQNRSSPPVYLLTLRILV